MTKNFYLAFYTKEMLANELVERDEIIVELKKCITSLNNKIKRLKANSQGDKNYG